MEVLIRILETQGFAILFGVAVMLFVYKNTPKFLKVWTDFTTAVADNTAKMASMNQEMIVMSNEIAKSQERTMSVLDRLKELDEQLSKHSADAHEIKENQAIMLKLLEDITNKIQLRKEAV